MGFKLGSERGNYAINGEIRTKMRFDKEGGDPNLSVPGTPVVIKDLEPGVVGEANMDGSIYISSEIDPNNPETRQIINHEMRHATDMKIGKLEYGDSYIRYNGEYFERKTIKGKDMINVYGEWKEAGDHDFPWEDDANNGNY